MAEQFNHSSLFRQAFEYKCMKLLVDAYHSALKEKKYSKDWMENDFTSLMNHYIGKNPYRIQEKISNKRENPLYNSEEEKVRGFANRENRIDLTFSTFGSEKEFHIFVEAKLLRQADRSLIKRYIETGIDSIINGKYPRGLLIGYQTEGSIELTITDGINELLIDRKREKEVLVYSPMSLHNDSYESCHDRYGTLKHLFFDFTA